MIDSQQIFDDLAQQYVEDQSDVQLGKMMSSPGLKYKNKVFAFFHDNHMGFRLGPHFDPEVFGLQKIKLLSPFKTKPPLKGWYMVEADEKHLWEPLCAEALAFTQTLT